MAEHQNGQEQGGKQILVVEDHTATAEMIQLLLEGEGYRVQWAKTAQLAFEMLSGCSVAELLHSIEGVLAH
ncbi:MAG TPA: hypothetical protein VEX13_01325 [Chloroflexia bacterium]|nr:hypothetical protein [Chloroflexia bacterium]